MSTAAAEHDNLTHLLFPVQHAFLAFRVSLFTVETEESDESAEHTLGKMSSAC